LLAEEIREALQEALLDSNQDVIKQTNLCDSCLGRLFGKIGKGAGNVQRGRHVRQSLGMADSEEATECQMCKGLVSKIETFAEMATESLNDWEFANFLVGTRFDPEIQEAEESIWVETGVSDAEPIKAEFNREIGKLIEEGIGKPAEFTRPDVVAIVDTMYESVDVQVSPIHFYGRYRKLSRGIPQTRWPCRECRGKGCDNCDGTGKMYQTSVEEIVGSVALTFTKGKDHRFHGMGREDIDALMLGKGRPFVLEVKEPKMRNIDFSSLEKAVNENTEDVEVSGLRRSDNEEVISLKSARPDKKYGIQIKFNTQVNEEKINEVVGSFGGTRVAQRTPQRVLHRRADRERVREIKEIEMKILSPTEALLNITAEAGTYIKELVHGDEGRTVPSISGELGVGCEVKTLDVLEILDDDEE
jgi:tRNA pseudouridine synthase 10